ncbi:VanZ family protein [Aquibacillus kalidii]|uniref:VanZ family protein n=1 Tax=Aquibacillus kalidii TaxID=2762597 RepID=UPI001644A5B4|nr:VanZ family protein [Aquibacillus kalidii]
MQHSVSLSFEIIQLVFKLGSFDVDDLILTTLGGILGYLPFYATLLFLNRKNQRKNEKLADC